MGSQTFSCIACEKEFDMRMKLNRHIAKAHKPSIDFTHAIKLTDDEKEQYFENLREKYIETKAQARHMEMKVKYLESYLKTVNSNQSQLDSVKDENMFELKKTRPLKKKKKKTTKKPLGRENSIGSYEDIEGDATIPEGWKSAIKNSYMPTCQKMIKNKVYWAPDGRYCPSRLQALAYMVSEDHPMEEVEEDVEQDGRERWFNLSQLAEV